MFECFKDKEFLRKFIKITLPVMISSLISFLVSFLDNIMVGMTSNETVSGVYAANELIYISTMAIYGITEGAGIFVQQYNGSNDSKHIKQCFRFKIYVTILLLLVLIPLIYLFGSNFINIYTKTDTNSSLILSEGVNYINIVALSLIPYAFSSTIFSTMKEIGKTKYPMASSIIAICTNALFNTLFIVILKMGGTGAAIATVISRVAELSFLIIISKIKHLDFTNKTFETLKIEKDLFKSISKKGTYLFINEIGFALGMVLQTMAFSQRDGVLSSISIMSTTSQIFEIVGTSMAVGVGVLIGSTLGVSDYTKAKDYSKKLHLLGMYIAIISGIILIALSPVIPKLFRKVDENQKTLATKLIIVFGLIYFAQAVTVISYFTLRAGGKTLQTFLFDSCTMIFLYVPVSWILSLYTNLDMLYVFIFVRLLDLVKCAIGLIFIKKGDWAKNITIFKNEKTEVL